MGLKMWSLLIFKSRFFWRPVPFVKSQVLNTKEMGLISQVHILKFGMPVVGFEPFTPQGEALVLSSLQVVVHCSVDWFLSCATFDDILCQSILLLWCDFLLICQIYNHHLANLFFKEEVFAYVIVDCLHGRRWVQDLPMLPSWTRTYTSPIHVWIYPTHLFISVIDNFIIYIHGFHWL